MLQKQAPGTRHPPLDPKIAERVKAVLRLWLGKVPEDAKTVSDKDFMAAVDRTFAENNPEAFARMIGFLREQVFGKQGKEQ